MFSLNLKTRFKYFQTLISIVLCLFIAFLFSACQTSSSKQSPAVKSIVKNGKVCGKSRGSFLGSWFDYYERGFSFADCSMWSESESDLRKALNKRSIDKRRVYSIGMHLISDYFPNRELGVALFYQQKFKQAQQHLLTSLSQFPSAKAEEYLKRTRLKLLQKADTKAPVIQLFSPVSNQAHTSKFIKVKGSVRDNHFMDSLLVNDVAYRHTPTFITKDKVPVRIVKSVSAFDFELEVPVKFEGEKAYVEVIAIDISGNKKTQKVNLLLDQQGPQISLKSIKKLQEDIVQINLTIQDEYSKIKQLMINGKNYTLKQKDPQLQISETISGPFDNNILVIAKDDMDNTTEAKLKIKDSIDAELLDTRQQESDLETALNIYLLKDELIRKTQESKAYISGEVEADKTIKRLLINGKNILRAASNHLYFSYNPDLVLGENQFNIVAEDNSGQSKTVRVSIYRSSPPSRALTERLMLAHFPFPCNKVSRAPCRVSANSFDLLNQKLVDRKRFQLTDKDTIIQLIDQSNACKKGVSDECVVKIAQQLVQQGRWDKTFDNALFAGSIIERSNEKNEVSVEISGRVIDYNTKETLTTLDIYAEGLDNNNYKIFSQSMITELADTFPLVEANVDFIRSKQVGLSIGKQHRVWESMPMFIFNTDEQKDCSNARLEVVEELQSIAYLETENCLESSESKHLKAITR